MSNWTPKNRDMYTMGGITRDGQYVPTGNQPNVRLRLSDSPQPMVARAGDFCESSPIDMPISIAVLGGLMVGLGISRISPHLAAELLDGIIETSKSGETTPHNDFVEQAAEMILFGKRNDFSN